jgi:hypothetical protein
MGTFFMFTGHLWLLRDGETNVQQVSGSILVGEHDGDGGPGIVDVERAAGGDELHKPCLPIVVADVEGDGHAVRAALATSGAGASAQDREAQHPDDVPQAAGFVLGRHSVGHGDVLIEHGAGEEDREPDAGLAGGGGNVNLKAVGEGLGAGVGVHKCKLRIAECGMIGVGRWGHGVMGKG